jgi:hypothetical protein
MDKKDLHREEGKIAQNDARLAVVITELGLVLPAQHASAQAIDQLGPWDRINLKACNEGYIEFAEEFNRCMRTCLQCAG